MVAMGISGLIVALAMALLGGLVFGTHPQWDLDIAGLFFTAGTDGFAHRLDPLLHILRQGAMWAAWAVVAIAPVAVIGKILRPRLPMLVPGRAVIFLLTTLALGPGLLTNVLLKGHWSRPRPISVLQFGGTEHFVPWWSALGDCARNCSFVSGDAAMAFWTLAAAALVPANWRPLAYAAAISFGASVGILRMAFGGHFFSDVWFAGIFTFLIVWLCYGAIYRWPATRLSDAAIESAIARLSPKRDSERAARRD
jgi:membrane-associated PAP2 superfamily phosphatase